MNKSANVTVELDDDAYAAFKEASEIVLKAGIRVPTSQLVQTMINAEMTRLNPRKIAQRFLRCPRFFQPPQRKLDLFFR
jgi:hypothetical protein